MAEGAVRWHTVGGGGAPADTVMAGDSTARWNCSASIRRNVVATSSTVLAVILLGVAGVLWGVEEGERVTPTSAGSWCWLLLALGVLCLGVSCGVACCRCPAAPPAGDTPTTTAHRVITNTNAYRYSSSSMSLSDGRATATPPPSPYPPDISTYYNTTLATTSIPLTTNKAAQ